MFSLIQYIFVCFFVCLSATTVAAPTINLSSDKASYTVGDKITLIVTLTDSSMIYGGGLDLTFNPAVVNADSVKVDPIWDFTIKEGVIDNATGIINDIFFTHFSGIEGDISVATIVLDTIASGSTGISIAESSAKPFTDTGGKSVVFVTNNLAGSVLVSSAVDETEDTTTDTTDTTSTDQTTNDQDTTTDQASTDNENYLPTYKPSDTRERSETIEPGSIENNGQYDNSSINEQINSDAFIVNTQQDYAETGSKYPENGYKEKPIDPASQTSSSTDKNSVISTNKQMSDKSPIVLLTIVFLILTFIGYKVFVYSKK